MDTIKSLLYFVLAGVCEIGGGYLVWMWLRGGRGAPGSIWMGRAGAALLVLYGIVPTFQAAHFGRVYAAYGGVFIVMAMLWSWKVDDIAPDRFDWIGAALILTGAGVMMYWPRR
jgi:small multidrug resistance family-3 protein